VALTILNGLIYFFWWDKPLGHIASRRPRTTKQVYCRRVKARPQYRHFFNALTFDWTSNDASSASRIPLNAVSSRGSDPYSFHCLRISAWPLLLVVRKFPPSVVKLPPSLLQISTRSARQAAQGHPERNRGYAEISLYQAQGPFIRKWSRCNQMPILSVILRVFLEFKKGRTKEPLERCSGGVSVLERWEKIYSAVSRPLGLRDRQCR